MMKKNVAYILVLVMAFSLLAGCGRVTDRDNPVVTNSPIVTNDMVPDVNDGIVEDDNGVIDNNGEIIEDNNRDDDRTTVNP